MAKRDLRFYSQLALKNNITLSEVFIREEERESGKSKHEIWELMRNRIAVMQESLNIGISHPQISRSGYINGGAYKMQTWLNNNSYLLSPVLTRLIIRAMAIPEVNACMGRIVAAPTAGSCGILPAVIFTVAEEKVIPEEQIIRGFFTAGGIGLVIEKHATLSGAEGGCQAECGSASAMAAGGVVEMMNGSPGQIEDSVSFALKNTMGLICDPVGGLVEIPCVKRNVLGAVNAIAAAEMALAGITSIFSADQIIEIMGKVGKRLPEEFRETSRGGLAELIR